MPFAEMAPEYLEPLHELEDNLKQAQDAACKEDQTCSLQPCFTFCYMQCELCLFSSCSSKEGAAGEFYCSVIVHTGHHKPYHC